MSALRAHAGGGPEQLQVESVPVPPVQAPSVLVEVRAEAAESTGFYDVVVDTVGGALNEEAIRLTRRGGTFVTLQQPPPSEPLVALGVEGVFFVVRPTRAGLDRVREAADGHQLRVTVAATFPLAEGRAAYESGALPHRKPGKAVLVVSENESSTAT